MVSRRLLTATEQKALEPQLPERPQHPQFGVIWLPAVIVLVFAVYHGFGLYAQEAL